MSVVDAVSPSNLEVLVRLLVATALGAVIGLERELDGQDAGTRTHALLALGAGLFGAASTGAFGDFVVIGTASNVQVDVTRIASYVAAGVGFLAGGAIVKQADRVRGLTTAASLWSTAALGLAAGLGFWVGAVAAAALTVLLLVLDRPLAVLRLRKRKRTLTVVMRPGGHPADVLGRLLPADDRSAGVSIARGDDGVARLTATGLSPQRAQALLMELQARDDVAEVLMP